METTSQNFQQLKEFIMVPSLSLQGLWQRIGRLSEDVQDLAVGLAAKPREWWLHSYPFPLVNMFERDDAFYIEAEMPGVAAENIEVLLRSGTELTIQGERSSPRGESGAWHNRERGAGRFHRTLTLAVPVEAEKVQARLEAGVLRLTLPKKPLFQPHRVPVQAAGNEMAASAPIHTS
jgi:HSP20 family protein